MPRWLSLVDAKPSQERCLGRLLKEAKATGSNPVRGSTQHLLGGASALLHMGDTVPPRRQLSHLI